MNGPLRDLTDWLDKLVRTGMAEVLKLRARSDHPPHYRKLASCERSVAFLKRITSSVEELAGLGRWRTPSRPTMPTHWSAFAGVSMVDRPDC